MVASASTVSAPLTGSSFSLPSQGNLSSRNANILSANVRVEGSSMDMQFAFPLVGPNDCKIVGLNGHEGPRISCRSAQLQMKSRNDAPCRCWIRVRTIGRLVDQRGQK